MDARTPWRLPPGTRRVALVTPPDSGRPILRDHYCTSTSKAGYYWAPIDLWVQGAYLAPHVEAQLFEGIGLDRETLLRRLAHFRPDLAVVLIGGFTAAADLAFVEELWRRQRVPVVVGGEAVLAPTAPWRERPWFAGHLYPFTASPVADDPATSTRWACGPPPAWSLRPYRHPFLGRPLATVLTTHGCPFACGYCNHARTVLGPPRERDFVDLEGELAAWARRGVRWLYLRDVQFGGTPARAKEILRRWRHHDFRFRWACWLRPETLDAELAELLAATGCRVVQMGVESADAETLRALGRGGDLDRVREAFALLARYGIRRGAHFVLGLPGDDETALAATLELALALDPDYAAFNLAVARYGTPWAATAPVGDSTRPHSEQLVGTLPPTKLLAWQRHAVRRFYLRPRYGWRLLAAVAADPALLGGFGTMLGGLLCPRILGRHRRNHRPIPSPNTVVAHHPSSGSATRT